MFLKDHFWKLLACAVVLYSVYFIETGNKQFSSQTSPQYPVNINGHLSAGNEHFEESGVFRAFKDTWPKQNEPATVHLSNGKIVNGFLNSSDGYCLLLATVNNGSVEAKSVFIPWSNISHISSSAITEPAKKTK